MADQFSKMYDVERVGGDQRQRLAEMLRANALNQPQGQMVSGWYVPPSMTQNLNQLAQTALGTYMGASLDEERKAKTAELLRELSQGKAVEPIPATQNFNGLDQRAEGQTPFPIQAPQNELQRLTQRPQSAEQSQINPSMMPKQEQRYVPLTEEEKIGKVMELAQYNPYAAQVWSAQDTARQNRLTKAEERELDFQRRKELLQDQLQGRMDLARLTAGLVASNRVAPQDRPLTEFQGKSVTFGTRAANANNILNALEGTTDPSQVYAAHKGGVVTNWMMPENVQRVTQAQRDFWNANLRQESGAAIGSSEFESAKKQYFPEPGDTPEVIAQKRKNRELVVKGFARQAGPAGAPDIMEIYNNPMPIVAPAQTQAPKGRLGGLTPPSNSNNGFSIRPK